MGTLLDAARKSAKLQVALSFLVGLAAAAALLLFAGVEDKDLIWKMPAVGVAAFVGALLFLSRTPQEIAAELSDQERRRQFESVARSIEQIESLARRSSWKATVNQPLLEVVQTARGTLDDLRQEFDAVRLQEFAGYLADFTDALGTGTGILLSVMIVYQLYEQIAMQHMEDMHPALRRFFGK